MINQKGFTLLELMTTLGIAAILSSTAVPGMQSFLLNSKQSSAVNQLVSSIHMARNAAVTRNSRVAICASGNGSSCGDVSWADGWIVFADDDRDQAVDAGEDIIAVSEKMENMTIASPQFSSAISYRGDGRVIAASNGGFAGGFTFCDRRGSVKAKVLSIEANGRPNSTKSDLNGASPNCG